MASGNFLYDAGSSNLMFCDSLEGRMRWEVHIGGDMCIPIVDSCSYRAATNTIL